MAIRTMGSPFGSETRTRVLVTLRLLGSSFQRELARILGRSPSVVQKALTGLERDGQGVVTQRGLDDAMQELGFERSDCRSSAS